MFLCFPAPLLQEITIRDHAAEDRNSDVFEDVSNDDTSEDEDGLENDLYHSDELESYGKLKGNQLLN